MHEPGIDAHIDLRAAKRRESERGADRGVRYRKGTSHVGKAAQQLHRPPGKLQHLHRRRGGGEETGLERFGPLRIVLRYRIGLCERRERRGVLFHAVQKPVPERCRLVKQLAQYRLDGGVFFLPDGELPHHAAERCGKRSGERACAAAARHGRLRGERRGKIVHAFAEHFHS